MIASFLAWIARLLTGASAYWVAPPMDARQRVYFANHSSHLDFAIIWSSLPPQLRERTRPVAGADYWNAGPVRRYLAARVFRAILIERGETDAGADPAARASKSIEAIASAMGDDQSIIVFPEGTRSPTGELQAFKSGLYHLARARPAAELVPVYLMNMSRILPKGEVVPVPLLGRVVFGAPLERREGGGEEKTAFLQRARDALQALREL